MPTEHFKSEEAYRKWNAYRHLHGIPAPNLKSVIIKGKKRKVHHEKDGLSSSIRKHRKRAER